MSTIKINVNTSRRLFVYSESRKTTLLSESELTSASGCRVNDHYTKFTSFRPFLETTCGLGVEVDIYKTGPLHS